MVQFFPNSNDVFAAFSEKDKGNMSPRHERQGEEQNAINKRSAWLRQLSIEPDKCVHINPQNEDDIACISNMKDIARVCGDEADKPVSSPKVDAVFCDRPHLYLTMPVADCALLFVYDTQYGIVGLIHAGWHTLNKNIVTHALECMKHKWNIRRLDNTYVQVSPYFHSYKRLVRDVSEEKRKFWFDNLAVTFNDKEYIFNIQTMICKQLVDAGVQLSFCDFSKAENTVGNERFWSQREFYWGESKSGRNLGVIGKL